MTEKEHLEARLLNVNSIIFYLQTGLEKYKREKDDLTMRLNRARRLEREAKELQQ